jgi:ABC-type multidrug transport system ATPase subunit
MMIRLRGVAFAYRPGEPVLEKVDLEIPAGLTLLLGPNGCGKSTLMRVIAGVERPDAGHVEIGGLDLWREEAAARKDLAYVPEQPDLTPYATVGEILTLVTRLRGETRDGGENSAIREAALASVGLEGLGRRSVRELSMGQRRRAVLAAAMIGSPRILILDEPLETLDRGMRESVVAWIDRLLGAGAAVVIVTHEIEPFVAAARRAMTVRDRRALMHDPLPPPGGERMTLLEGLARGTSA